MFTLLEQTTQLFVEGGWVIVPLALASFILCFALCYRYLTLSCIRHYENIDLNKKVTTDNLVEHSLLVAQKVKEQKGHFWQESLVAHIEPIKLEASKYSSLIKAIVFIAPLLGLLGTVGGMIETFDSLGDKSLFSSSGGIAGGISQALLTTQMGLIVAIPGLFAGRYLDGLEKKFLALISQLQDQLSYEIKTGVQN